MIPSLGPWKKEDLPFVFLDLRYLTQNMYIIHNHMNIYESYLSVNFTIFLCKWIESHCVYYHSSLSCLLDILGASFPYKDGHLLPRSGKFSSVIVLTWICSTFKFCSVSLLKGSLGPAHSTCAVLKKKTKSYIYLNDLILLPCLQALILCLIWGLLGLMWVQEWVLEEIQERRLV